MLVLLFFCSVVSFSQTSGRLRGMVTDSTSGEALAYGNVFIKELKIGASTDDRGYYYIASIPANKSYTLLVSYVGYVSKSIHVLISPNKITNVNVSLLPSSIELQTVEKVGEKVIEKNETNIGLQRIAIKDLEALPKGVETDVFRSLQYVAGVNFTGDVSARYYVRGGDSNQNLVLLNGATVYNPFHALGLFSVIDPDMIKNMEFYKGGFTAEYGGRLSSVLNLITKDGNKNRISGQASMSMLTAKALVEGPISHGSFILTGRKSYNTEILKKFLNEQTAPFDFYDVSFKLNYSNPNFIPGAKFVVHGFLSHDKLDNTNPLKEDFNWANNIFGFSWFQVYDSPLFSELNISVSDFNGEVIPNLSNTRAKRNEVQDITLNLKFNFLFDNKDEIVAGAQINTMDTKLFLENDIGVFSDVNGKGANISLFAKYKFLRFEEFGLDIGGRYNLTGLSKGGAGYFEPRISLTYSPLPVIVFKAAWGKYQQEITTLSDENEVISLFEPFVIVPDYLEMPRATHYTLGADIFFTEFWKFSTEVYYKYLENITAINTDKKFAADNDLVSGTGESYGIEASTHITLNPVRFTASYALAYSYKKINDWTYYPRYDSRHAVNLSLEYNIGKGWKTSITWVFKTGLPFTPIIGYYDKLFLGDFSNDWDIYSHYIPFSVLGDRNIERLPNYHRMDLSLSKVVQLGFMKIDLNASIVNVYNRKNIFYFDRSTGEIVNMLPFLPTVSVKVKL